MHICGQKCICVETGGENLTKVDTHRKSYHSVHVCFFFDNDTFKTEM